MKFRTPGTTPGFWYGFASVWHVDDPVDFGRTVGNFSKGGLIAVAVLSAMTLAVYILRTYLP